MAVDPCARGTILTRSGLTQPGRRLAELSRQYFLPDERDLADLVLFGQRFARQIRFYDTGNVPDGDWAVFFESDVTAALAALSKLPIEAVSTFQGDVGRWLRADPARDPAALSVHFRLWFHLAVVPLEQIGRHMARLPGDHLLAQALPRLVARDLAAPMASLAAWYRGAIKDGAAGDPDLFDDVPVTAAGLNLTGAAGNTAPRVSATVAGLVLDRPAFSALVIQPKLLGELPTQTWAALYAGAGEDVSPYADAAGAYERIYDGLSYNLLERAVERLMQGYLRVRADASAALTASLTEFAAHPAHYGLWLVFLQLFRHAQGEMNQFTGRHLDFYFRDVLRLKPRAAVPDSAHLTFELAKGVEALLLGKDTAFRAGKDALGKPVSFALANDIVVNPAQVELLSAVRVVAETVGSVAEVSVRAAPVIASADGLGEVPLPKENPAFAAFGPDAAPFSRVGFAIADRRLFLREGQRQIIIGATVSRPLPQGLSPKLIVRLSGSDGWFEPQAVLFRVLNDYQGDARDTVEMDGFGYVADRQHGGTRAKKSKTRGAVKGVKDDVRAREETMRQEAETRQVYGKAPSQQPQVVNRFDIVIVLSPTDPAVVPVDPDLHGAEHAAGIPVAEVSLDFTAQATRRAYATLRNLTIARPTLQVSAVGVKDLSVVAAGAEADPAKPFAPFGPRPQVGNTLIIGSSEIFSKPIEGWALRVGWQTPHSDTGFFKSQSTSGVGVREYILSDGQWVAAVQSTGSGARSGSTAIALGAASGTVSLASGDVIDGLADQTIENPSYEATAMTGFLKLSLIDDFGHHQYPTEQARAMVSLARGVAYTLNAKYNYEGHVLPSTLGALPKIPYDAVVTEISAAYASTRSVVASFRHLHPFGTALASGGRLFPPFEYEAALFVGIRDFSGPARLTLLTQVEDGSGDPLLPVPDLSFAYLDGDRFVAMEGQDVDDKSLNLTTSGVIGLGLPREADRDHAILPDGLTWVRIAAPDYAAAVNRLRGVIAQAARVTFVDDGNDPQRLLTPLPAQTIAKTVVPEPKLKKIVQPFVGFGGRMLEASEAMDTRVSERLRHKDRGVTMWDVEALVLDAFPQLYRVKCLGLTEPVRDGAGVVLADNEARPGAVTVVAVPTIAAGSTRDPLRPYVDQATLIAVDQFLRKRLSPFVRLEVVNPRIEEVHVALKVRFRQGIADTAFYMDRLNQALIAFLTPWMGDANREVSFGGKLWKSTLIDFLDEVPEVDFVTDVQMFHKPDVALAEGAWTPIDSDVIETTSARSILVSAARHRISELAGGVLT